MEASAFQSIQINKVRDLIRELAPYLEEKDGDSKWTEGKIIFKSPGTPEGYYVYMVGPISSDLTTFHLMPMYSDPDMQKKYIKVLKPFSSGKTSLNFREFEELPLEAIKDIITRGTKPFMEAEAKRLHRK
jgi:hypothetical protein